jgi:beta-glucosidase-like glycosyl hydrolase
VNTDFAWESYLKKINASGPAYHGCDTPQSGSTLAWCNHSLSHEIRIDLLLTAMTLAEKVSLLTPNASIAHNTCNDHTRGAPRLGLGQYMWLDETNTGASSACLGPGHCATTFPGPIGMGASFNRTSWNLKGGALGTEVRALNIIAWHRNAGGTYSEMIGLTGFRPNINNPRARPTIRPVERVAS